MTSKALTVAFLAFLVSTAAAACPVCFGDSDGEMARGANNGILFLLGVVFFVQAGLVAIFWSIWRRTRQLRELRSKFELLEGGAR